MIRAIRKSLGISQSELARLLGLSGHARIAEYESGKRNPSAAVVMLARAYADGRLPLDWPDRT